MPESLFADESENKSIAVKKTQLTGLHRESRSLLQGLEKPVL